MKQYIVAYDITCQKRASKVRKLVYSYSMSGQKSVLEVFLDRKSLNELKRHLEPLLKKKDSVNIIEVSSEVMVFGKANFLDYDNGIIVI